MNSQELFDKWYSGRRLNMTYSAALEVWNASRASIEIQQPHFITSREAVAKGYMVEYSNGFGDGMDAYEANIKAAGLMIKEE